MENTVEVILDFLRRNNFSNAESALRAELMAMKEGAQPPLMVDELPRLPPVRIQSGKRNCNDNKDDDNRGGVNSTKSFDSALFLSMENTPEGFFTLGSSSSSSGGVKNLCGTRPSTSQAMFEDQLSDQLSGFATAVSHGDCLSEFALNYPFQCWDDSDTYENDDDPGYHRQPIEDKVWFLTHEIEHPNGDDEQEGMLQNGCNLNESLANLDGDTKSLVEEEACCLPADENKLRNSQQERAQLNNRGEILNSEAFDLLKTSNPWHHVSKEIQVKPSDEVWDDCGGNYHHFSTEIDGKYLSAAKPDNILVNNDMVVSGDESMGVESNGEMENPRKEDLEVEESLHVSYCQRSSFKECSKASRIRHFDSEDEMVGPSEDVYEDQHRHHVYYNKSSRHILELQLPEQDLNENSSLLNSSTKDYKCKSDESPCSSSTRSKEILGMGLFEHSNLSSQTNNDYLCMGTKGESEVEETMHKEIAYEEFVGEEDEDMEAMQNEIQASEEDEYEEFDLKIIHRKNRTGFEEEKDLDLVINSVIAGRYHVIEYLGSAAFSKAIQAHDLHSGMDVCMKIIKNNKDFFDQSLDEIKLLKYVNRHDPTDRYHILRLYDYFYHKEHLFIVCELLRANLYEFQKFNNESGGEAYFTMPRLQFIALQCLEALQFLHSLGIIHCDLKPENILVKSYSRCEIKVIDLGSSCFQTDQLCPYVQSRAYRAPEVLLGLPYDQKIDIWSLGCILAELCSGNVLFQNDSVTTLLARIIGILGPIDPEMLEKGQDTHKYFTKNYVLYEQIEETEQLEYILPKKTSLSHRLPTADAGFLEFVGYLLQVNPAHRPTAKEALDHPWISCPYEPISS